MLVTISEVQAGDHGEEDDGSARGIVEQRFGG